MAGLKIPIELCRNFIRDGDEAVEAAVGLIDYMAHHIGVDNLATLDVLDVGCGVRFSQAFVDRDVPIGSYVGVDAAGDVIDFLSANVNDPRLSFLHLDVHNELYNPDGVPLTATTPLPLGKREFDLICLFSVFTHLAPVDYVAMLKLLRQFAKPDGRLFLTLFINERTEGGHGLIDGLSNAAAANVDEASMPAHRSVPDFVDLYRDKPLMWAVYSRSHALDLIEGTGWEVVSVTDPLPYIQHHIVCRPI
jgi:SAM-dependent methyltransferase